MELEIVRQIRENGGCIVEDRLGHELDTVNCVSELIKRGAIFRLDPHLILVDNRWPLRETLSPREKQDLITAMQMPNTTTHNRFKDAMMALETQESHIRKDSEMDADKAAKAEAKRRKKLMAPLRTNRHLNNDIDLVVLHV